MKLRWYAVRMRWCIAAIVSTSTSACSDDASTLSELSIRRLHASVYPLVTEAPLNSIKLEYAPRDVAGEECSVLDPVSVRATFGGTELPFEEFRSVFGGLSMNGGSYCVMSFSGPLVTPRNGMVTVSDGSFEVAATFEQAALEPRTASHPTWSLTRGEMATLRWSHPSDLSGDETTANIHLASGVPDFPVTIVVPDGITFVVPSEHPVGPFDITVTVESRPAGPENAFECINALTCEATQGRAYRHQVAVN